MVSFFPAVMPLHSEMSVLLLNWNSSSSSSVERKIWLLFDWALTVPVTVPTFGSALDDAAEEASLVVAVFDGSRPLDGEDREILALCKGKNAVAVINKTDLEGCDLSEVREAFGDVLELSAKTGTGVDELTAWLLKNAPDETEILITGERQAALIRAAAEALRDAQQSAELGLTADAFLLDAERAARLIGQVLGDDVDIDIAHGIFSRFCVGK